MKKFQKRRGQYSVDDSFSGENKEEHGLPGVPRAHMTGVRTFIDAQGRSNVGSSTQSSTLKGKLHSAEEDEYPLTSYKQQGPNMV